MTAHHRTALICTSALVALCANSRALIALGPYQPIVVRNVFHLVPQVATPPATNQVLMPRIILTGITTVVRNKLALFRVQWPSQSSVPAREQSYILAQGEREGDIEVLEIDEKAATIKLNVRGTILVLSLDKDGIKPPAGPPVLLSPAMTMPIPARPSVTPQLSPEQQIILMEVEREKTRQEVQTGALPPLPPSPLSPQ